MDGEQILTVCKESNKHKMVPELLLLLLLKEQQHDIRDANNAMLASHVPCCHGKLLATMSSFRRTVIIGREQTGLRAI